MKYTAEEVRDYANACRLAHKGPVIADMLTELAERIKVDESAAPVGFVMEATATRHKFGLLTQDLPPGAELFTRPPAQATQVDPAAKPRTLADFVNAPDAERTQIGQQVAARVDEMMAEPVAQGEPSPRCDKPGCNCATWKPEGCAWDDAEPVAQGESGVIRHVGYSRFESWFSEYVVGQNGAKQQARDAYGAGLAEQAERLAAQPRAVPTVPEGWVLVPREPTAAMLDAAMTREDDEPLTDWGKIIPAPHAEIYKAMLTAVPSAPEGESHE